MLWRTIGASISLTRISPMAGIDGDFPLSVILSIAGIFTFLTAVIATAWLKFNAVGKAERERNKSFHGDYESVRCLPSQFWPLLTRYRSERERDRLEHMYEFKY